MQEATLLLLSASVAVLGVLGIIPAAITIRLCNRNNRQAEWRQAVAQTMDDPFFYEVSSSVLRSESFIPKVIGFNFVFSHQRTPSHKQTGLSLDLLYCH